MLGRIGIAGILLATFVGANDGVRHVSRDTGKSKGAGSKAEPAKYFWRQLKAAKPGDTFHLAGPVHGWRGSGKFSIKVSGLKLHGGYAPDFATRDVTRHPTTFQRPAGSETVDRQATMLELRGSGFVLDGLVFDQAGHNVYAGGSLDTGRSRVSPTVAVHFRGKVVIRNCAFVNAAFTALLLAGTGAGEVVVENCVFLNCVGPAVRVRGGKTKFVFRNNTFAMIHPRGTTPGACIELGSEGTLIAENNVFAYATHALSTLRGNLGVTFRGNVVHALSSVLLYAQDGKIARAGLDDLEEVDFTAAENNRASDPDLQLEPAHLLAYLAGSGLDKALLDREVARAKGRLSGGAADPAKKDAAKDPFEDDPFEDEKGSTEAGPEAGHREDKKGSVGEKGAFAAPYPPAKAYVTVGAAGNAGARAQTK